jgi:hypothetical protein
MTGDCVTFYDGATKRWMKYIYPDSKHWAAGWLFYKHPDGQWVTLRRASDEDVEAITAAVVAAHHAEAHHAD